MANTIIELAQQLIARKSISPHDAGCQQILIEKLTLAGFHIEKFDIEDTKNLWAWHGDATRGKTLVFAGHTDVVPAGDDHVWTFPPFEPTVENGFLYGRGAADMKGSLAAMTIASINFVKHNPNHNGRIALLITSDEEASAKNGTQRVVETLIQRQEKVDYCLVGEPSSMNQLGDIIKNGRRGSLTARLTLYGTQGHVAYPDLADNPIHSSLPVLLELVQTQWDHGNAFFPASSMQITNITAGTGAGNVIPGTLNIQFNFRFSSELTEQSIKQRVADILEKHNTHYSIDWRLSGNPFLTPQGIFTKTISDIIYRYTGLTTQLSTSGGTSDGRFIAQMGCEVVELGPLNATIHKVNECVSVTDLQQLGLIYQEILQQLLAQEG